MLFITIKKGYVEHGAIISNKDIYFINTSWKGIVEIEATLQIIRMLDKKDSPCTQRTNTLKIVIDGQVDLNIYYW